MAWVGRCAVRQLAPERVVHDRIGQGSHYLFADVKLGPTARVQVEHSHWYNIPRRSRAVFPQTVRQRTPERMAVQIYDRALKAYVFEGVCVVGMCSLVALLAATNVPRIPRSFPVVALVVVGAAIVALAPATRLRGSAAGGLLAGSSDGQNSALTATAERAARILLAFPAAAVLLWLAIPLAWGWTLGFIWLALLPYLLLGRRKATHAGG